MLTKKVFLNACATFLDYGARVAVVLVTTPMLLHGLGASLFGVWQMLTRMGEHLAPSDGRSAVAFRWMIVERQADAEGHAKRRVLASALIVWLYFVPLFVLLGSVLVWLAPWITNVAADYHAAVRIAMGLVVVSTIVATLKMFPGGVLFGENLAHKNMGVMAGTTILAGVLVVLALYTGSGLYGVALATLISTAIGAYVSYVVAKRHVAWFGLDKPSRGEINRTLRLSGWYVAWSVVENALVGADIMVLGYMASSEQVTRYVITAYAVQTVTTIVLTWISAALPGLGSIVGQGELGKASAIRMETIRYTWLLGMVIGATVLLCNQSFVGVWVGERQYAGELENLMIVAVTVQLVFIRVDAAVINLALDMRDKVLLGAGAAALSIALAIALIPQFGIIGLCIALILGRALLTVAYPRIVHVFLRDERKGGWLQWTRIVCTTLAMLSVAWILGRHLDITSWGRLLALALVGVVVSSGVAYALALTKSQKAVLIGRFRSLIRY